LPVAAQASPGWNTVHSYSQTSDQLGVCNKKTLANIAGSLISWPSQIGIFVVGISSSIAGLRSGRASDHSPRRRIVSCTGGSQHSSRTCHPHKRFPTKPAVGIGSSRAAGGAALAISDVELGDLRSGCHRPGPAGRSADLQGGAKLGRGLARIILLIYHRGVAEAV
jgi:hypothetical protein